MVKKLNDADGLGLIASLARATQAGLGWDTVNGSEYAFVAESEQFRYEINNGEDPDEDNRYFDLLVGRRHPSAVVALVTSEGSYESRDAPSQVATDLQSLYWMIKQKTLRTDSVVQDVLADLSKLAGPTA